MVVFDFEGLDDVSTIDDPHHYARGVEHVLVNGTQVAVDGGEHTGARPGRHLLRAMIDLRSDLCSVPTRRCGRRCARAELGWATVGEDASVNELCARVAELLGKPAAVWVPTCGMANLVALLTFCERGDDRSCSSRPPTCSRPRRWGSSRSRGSSRRRSGRADGRMEPDAVEELDRASAGPPLLVLENTHTRAGGTTLSPELTRRRSPPRPSGTTVASTSTARAS